MTSSLEQNRNLLEQLRRECALDLLGVADTRGHVDVLAGFPEKVRDSAPLAVVIGLRVSRAVLSILEDGPNLRRIGLRGRVVMVGRDIGTVVLPEADLKIYLIATAEERARRRFDEILSRGGSASYPEILAKVIERDRIDSTRDVAPLRPAEDAVVLDSDQLNATKSLKRSLLWSDERGVSRSPAVQIQPSNFESGLSLSFSHPGTCEHHRRGEHPARQAMRDRR